MARSDGPVPTLLIRLRRLNPTGVFLATLALALVALLTPGLPGAVITLALVLALAFLARLTWRFVPFRMKLARLVILALLVVIAVVKIIAATR